MFPAARPGFKAPLVLLWLAAIAGAGGCSERVATDESFGISTPYAIESLDPHARDLHSEASLCANLYEPLVVRDLELKLRPALALRWLSPSPTTWVFVLRPGVTFHDGRVLSPADVVASFERLRQHPELERGISAREIESVRAVGATSIEIQTRRPVPSLLNAISLIAILPAGRADAERPVGTGPYRFVEWKRGESVLLDRYDGYWGPRPAAKHVVVRLGRNPDQAAADLLSGRSRLATIGSREAESALAKNRALRVEKRTGLFLKFLGFDLAIDAPPDVSGARGNPFKDPLVRRALSLAIDRDGLTASLAEPALPANQPVPPVVFGHNPALPALQRDLPRARELQRQAGYNDGFGMTLRARRAAGSAGAPVAAMLREVGIRVTLVELDEGPFARSSGGAYLARVACETGDAADLLSIMMQSTAAPLMATMQGGPAFLRALQESVESESPDLRGGALRQIMAVAIESLPIVPLYFDEDVYGVSTSWRWRPRADGYVLAAEATPVEAGAR